MEFVYRFRQVRAKQIERLFFADGSPASRAVRCRRTLLRLVNARLLGRLERAVGGMTGSEGYIYQRPRSRRRTPDLHTLTTTELYVRLREAERQGVLELTLAFRVAVV